MAIGARPWQLRWLVLRRPMLQLGVGLLFGVACTMAWERVFANYAGPAALSDPLNVVGAALLLVLVGAIACLAPARRGTRLDPVLALRYE
ncbi:MAG: hypothetical protein LC804_23410 [Acidobacteria bacterium]|nr:hypothetical protein [Acidobacteriota bacterium]